MDPSYVLCFVLVSAAMGLGAIGCEWREIERTKGTCKVLDRRPYPDYDEGEEV